EAIQDWCGARTRLGTKHVRVAEHKPQQRCNVHEHLGCAKAAAVVDVFGSIHILLFIPSHGNINDGANEVADQPGTQIGVAFVVPGKKKHKDRGHKFAQQYQGGDDVHKV